MLNQIFDDQIALGLAQAAAVTVLSLIVLVIARRQEIHLEREILVALARGIVQVVAAGSVLVLILQGPLPIGGLVLLGMIVAAAVIARRRAEDIPDVFEVALYGVGLGAGIVIVLMTWLGVIEQNLSSLVPVGSMIVANSMNVCALALERFRAEVESHVGIIETGLSLGADPHDVVTPYVRAAVAASLIPRIDSIRSLGIVWIPGLMSGMILSGTDPVYAAIYQFVVIAMIFASSGLTAIISGLFIRSRIFTPAEQLVLQPGE